MSGFWMLVLSVMAMEAVVIWVCIKGLIRSGNTTNLHHEIRLLRPKWEPAVPVNIKRTTQAFEQHVGCKRTFAVFKNGTCVLLSNGSQNKEKEAVATLERASHYYSDFKSEKLKEGHFLVGYALPVYSIVFHDEAKVYKNYIEENYLDGLIRSEMLNTSQTNDIDKIGLFARARMFMDAHYPEIVAIWTPVRG